MFRPRPLCEGWQTPKPDLTWPVNVNVNVNVNVHHGRAFGSMSEWHLDP